MLTRLFMETFRRFLSYPFSTAMIHSCNVESGSDGKYNTFAFICLYVSVTTIILEKCGTIFQCQTMSIQGRFYSGHRHLPQNFPNFVKFLGKMAARRKFCIVGENLAPQTKSPGYGPAIISHIYILQSSYRIFKHSFLGGILSYKTVFKEHAVVKYKIFDYTPQWKTLYIIV